MLENRARREFFQQPTLEVAKNLLGSTLVFGKYKAIITETEAYFGFDDPASHAAKGKTKRNEIMFGEAGFSYVYLIYGMYNCFNIVTEAKDFPAAVLIRGIKLIDEPFTHFDGPGKLCKYISLATKKHNKIDITKSDNFYIIPAKKMAEYYATPRIGIKQGVDKLWRFVLKDI